MPIPPQQPAPTAVHLPEVWAGPECSFVEARGVLRDQLRETGHVDRSADVGRLAGLGIRAVRLPILWGWPDGRDGFDAAWAAARVEAFEARGVRIVAGLLHHGWGPSGTSPLDPDYPERFAEHAATVAEAFPGIDAFLPVNEPMTTARFSGLYGWWSPYGSSWPMFAALLLAQCVAIQEAARVLRALRPTATIVVNEDLGRAVGPPSVGEVIERHERRRWSTFDLLMGRVGPRHPLWADLGVDALAVRRLEALAADPVQPDLLGLDYYVTSDRYLDDVLEPYPEHVRAGHDGGRYVDIESVRVAGLPFGGFGPLIREAWARYGRPLALTEVQLAGESADQVAWWREAWAAARRAVRDGIPVQAVTAWSAFGAWDWDSVLLAEGRRYEPGCFDATLPRPRATPLAAAVRASAVPGLDPRGSRLPAGWWRRSDRYRYRTDITGTDAS